MKKNQLIVLFILLLLLSACAHNESFSRKYYILEYFNHLEKDELFRDESLPYSVMLLDSRISQTYDRKQIVRRAYGPKIQYSEYDLWGVKLSKIIPDLIAKRMDSYHTFKQVQREFFKELPDYQIMTIINNIEILELENTMQARLSMEFILKTSDREKIIVKHVVNREKNIPDLTVDTFVQNINDLILAETDNFILKIESYFGGENEIELLEDSAENIDFSMIDFYDDKDVSEGSGLLFLPTLTYSENEPYYQIIDSDGNRTMGRFGEAEPLMSGIYSVLYGSGDNYQKIRKDNIEIVPRYKKIIEPEWGCMIVDVIDKSRNYAKVNYEIFSLETGESFGSEFPAEEEVGELDKIWILKPGIYKVVINNEAFNSYTNFTTVQVDENTAKQLTIVVDTDDDGNPLNLVGAGVLEEIYATTDLSHTKYTNAIHANMNFYSNNSINSDQQIYTATANIQYDYNFIYDNYPYHYSLKTLLEEGLTKTTDSEFQKSADNIDARNTFLYYFFEDIGFYGRFDIQTHLISDKVTLADSINYAKFDVDNQLEEYQVYEGEQLELQLTPSILPFKMKEGFGVNYRILKKSKANLSVRAGLGFHQDFNSNVYSYVDLGNEGAYNDTIDGVVITKANKYVEEDDDITQGTELSLIASFQLPINLSYTTSAEVLIPFQQDETLSFEWENSLDLRLFKYLSLNYKLKLLNKKPEQAEEFLLSEHSLFLRLTFFLN